MAHQAVTQEKKAGHKTLAEGHADCFFNNNGTVHHNFVPVQQTVNSTIYTEILKCLRNASGQENRIYDREIRCADHATPSIRKSWH
jgi:hypothetical protein